MNQAQVGLHVAIGATIDGLAIVGTFSTAMSHPAV